MEITKEKIYNEYYLTVSKYANNGRLYLGLENEIESYCDITINLTGAYLEPNEIALDTWCPVKDMEEIGLFKVTREINYNYGVYKVAEINREIIEKYGLEF